MERTADPMVVRMALAIAVSAVVALGQAATPAPATPAVSSEAPKPVVPAKPVIFKLTYAESEKPQIVRICYLDEGTLEIVLPPMVVVNPDSSPSSEKKEAEPPQPQVVHVTNLDEGERAIVVEE